MKKAFIFLFATFPFLCLAQKKYTISGQVKDGRTGEALIGATITVKELPTTGTTTNSYGFYSITLSEGKYSFIAQSIGYKPLEQAVSLSSNQKVDFVLSQAQMELEEIVVESSREGNNVNRVEMGVERLEVKEISKIPVVLGEKDVIKTIQLLPGVKTSGEGNVGFFVRGGGSDQNLILLDEAPVYNPSHLLGFFSVFNSDAIKDVTLYKGSMPAEYGGRLSSVLDIKMNEGNSKDFKVNGGIGLISSRLTVQGPIVENKSSFILSGRRTYGDLFLKLSDEEFLKNSKLYFYDLNLKANYKLNENNQIFFSGYLGRDAMDMGEVFGLYWGNETATVRWNHLFNTMLFSNTSLIYSNYSYDVEDSDNGVDYYTSSRIKDYNLKQDFQFYNAPGSVIKFGLNSIYHTIIPGVLSDKKGSKTSELHLQRYSLENAVYASHEISLTSKLKVMYGLRLSSFSIIGPGDFYSVDEAGEINDTLSYSSGNVIKTYWIPEPRISLNYRLNENSSIKAAYTRTSQNLHLISSAAISQPTDIWVPSSNYIKPEIGDQYSAGFFKTLAQGQYELSAEGYFKNLQNQIEIKDGAEIRGNNNVESELLSGIGRAFGLELLAKKTRGKLNGWIGYTLSRTERKIMGINKGEFFPARQDRTHDIVAVAIYDISRKWALSANWVYSTGNAVTFPSGKYAVDEQVLNYYTQRNGYRMPAYHRLDLGATWSRKKTEKFESSWTFSIYNAYARQNPFMYNFRPNAVDPSRSEAVQLSLFSIVPAFTYNFKF